MSDPNVRELGRVQDIDDITLTVGVDYDTVSIGHPFGTLYRLPLEKAEQFAQLFVSAAWQAGQNARRQGEEVLEAHTCRAGCEHDPGDGHSSSGYARNH